MTTTFYASANDFHTLAADVAHAGTSSTAGDACELRMGNGTYAPTAHEVLIFLEICKRWIIQGGTDQLGANLPANRG